MSPRLPLLIASLAPCVSCTAPATLFVERSWEADVVAVLALTDDAGRPIEDRPHLLLPGEGLTVAPTIEGSFRVVAQTYALGARGARELSECAVSFNGAGALLGAPNAVWATPVIEAGGDQLVRLVPSVEVQPLEIRRYCTTPAPTACGAVAASLDRAQGDHDLHQVALLEDESVLAIDVVDAEAGPTRLLRMPIGGGGDPLGLLGPATGPISVVSDHQGLNLVAWRDGSVLRVDEAGVEQQRWMMPAAIAPALAVGRDGTIIAWVANVAYELSLSSSVARVRADFPPELVDVVVVRRDRILASTRSGLHYFDGTSWKPEGSAVIGELRPFGDERNLGAVGASGIFVRNEIDGTWSQLASPLEDFGSKIYDGVFAADGALLVVGEIGLVALWDGKQWCQLELGTAGYLYDLDPSRDGRRAVASIVLAGVIAYVVRLDFSELVDDP